MAYKCCAGRPDKVLGKWVAPLPEAEGDGDFLSVRFYVPNHSEFGDALAGLARMGHLREG